MNEIPVDWKKVEIIAVGGSAGSFLPVSALAAALPASFPLPVVFCLHRQRDKRHGFAEALRQKATLPVVEPEDKEAIRAAHIYVAPANYHLLVGHRDRFGLSTTEPVQYSRPSIDVFFESVADHYGPSAFGLLLSGANRDGAEGLAHLEARGAQVAVQEPSEAKVPTMPLAGLELCPNAHRLPLNVLWNSLLKAILPQIE